MTPLLLVLVLSSGCSTFKEIASAAAERAAARAIEAGKSSLADLGKQANQGMRDLGADLYSAAKDELRATGNLTAMKAGEIVGTSLDEHLPKPVAEAGQSALLDYLKQQQLVETRNEHGEVIPPIPEADMSMFQKLLLGLASAGTTAVTGAAVSHSGKNRHDKRTQREQQLLYMAPPVNGHAATPAIPAAPVTDVAA